MAVAEEAQVAAIARLVSGFSTSRSELPHPMRLQLPLRLRNRLSRRSRLRHRSQDRPLLSLLRPRLRPQAQLCRVLVQARAVRAAAAQDRAQVAESGRASVREREVEQAPALVVVRAPIIPRRRRSSSFRLSPRPRRCADIISPRISTSTKRETRSSLASIHLRTAATTASCAMCCWL